MIIERAPAVRLGVRDPRFKFDVLPKRADAWAGRRVLLVGGEPTFELSFWCGTCGFVFERIKSDDAVPGADPGFGDRLAAGLTEIDPEIVAAYAAVLPEGDYVPILLEILPVLVETGGDRDYFVHEKLDTFWGPVTDPKTSYYRTFEAPIGDEAHLYEFVVPMVPPTWNDRQRVAEYAERNESEALPTAVAVSILDVTAPATDQGPDWYSHWSLTHFLLDGHHKLEAAARAGTPVRLLSLVAISDGLSTPGHVSEALHIRASQPSAPRLPVARSQ